jgi:hypothetical protein
MLKGKKLNCYNTSVEVENVNPNDNNVVASNLKILNNIIIMNF